VLSLRETARTKSGKNYKAKSEAISEGSRWSGFTPPPPRKIFRGRCSDDRIDF